MTEDVALGCPANPPLHGEEIFSFHLSVVLSRCNRSTFEVLNNELYSHMPPDYRWLPASRGRTVVLNNVHLCVSTSCRYENAGTCDTVDSASSIYSIRSNLLYLELKVGAHFNIHYTHTGIYLRLYCCSERSTSVASSLSW